MSLEFGGQRALVTGGSRGIGAAIARRLAEGGAVVATVARAPGESPAPGPFIAADIGTAKGAADTARRVLDELGGIDILVNNAGGSSAPIGGVLALSDEDWEQTLAINLMSAVRLDRAILPGMLERGSGVIIHISSIQRVMPLPDSTLAYAAAKAALSNYSKGLSGKR